MATMKDSENEKPILNQFHKRNAFTTPGGYFDSLEENIMQSVFLENLKENDNHGFNIPHHYFEDFNQQITSETNLRNLLKNKSEGFSVPQDYFNQLRRTILDRSTENGKIKSFFNWKPYYKYVAAACITLFLTGTIIINNYYKNYQSNSQTTNIEQSLYNIDEATIIEYINENQNQNSQKLNKEELEDYILNNFTTNDIIRNL